MQWDKTSSELLEPGQLNEPVKRKKVVRKKINRKVNELKTGTKEVVDKEGNENYALEVCSPVSDLQVEKMLDSSKKNRNPRT